MLKNARGFARTMVPEGRRMVDAVRGRHTARHGVAAIIAGPLAPVCGEILRGLSSETYGL